MPLLIRESDLREILTMRELIPPMRRALESFSAGRAVQPVRTMVPVDASHGALAVMPAYLETPRALGVKVVTVYRDNEARSLPSHLATILLLDTATGALLALMDGRLITEMRTAAVSGAATDVLARAGAGVLAVLGAGVQARSHIEAMAEVRRLAEVRVWNRTPARAGSLAAAVRERLGLAATAARTAEEAVRGADLVCTVTASETPVVRGAWLRPGTHLNCIGAFRATMREVDTEAVVRSRVFVDSRAAALAESGDLVIPLREGAIGETHIRGEIGEVFAGRIQGRTAADEITMFESVGQAVEDVATAEFVYQEACRRGIGESLTFD
jgi:alanine dehydrogenase